MKYLESLGYSFGRLSLSRLLINAIHNWYFDEIDLVFKYITAIKKIIRD